MEQIKSSDKNIKKVIIKIKKKVNTSNKASAFPIK
jgi:hypothetical protein